MRTVRPLKPRQDSTWEVEAGGSGCDVNLSYTKNLRPAWAIREPGSTNKIRQ